MQQKWWLVAAGALGIALAVLLFPKPDTGDVPGGDPTNANPLDFKDEGPTLTKAGQRPERRTSVKDLRPINGKLGPNPVAAQMMQQRNTPEAVHAIRLSGPWTVIRRQLMTGEDEDGKAWGTGLAQLILDLRALRRDPESQDWDELRQRQEAALDELKANPTWIADEVIVSQVQRIADTFQSYEDTIAAGTNTEEELTVAPTKGDAPLNTKE